MVNPYKIYKYRTYRGPSNELRVVIDVVSTGDNPHVDYVVVGQTLTTSLGGGGKVRTCSLKQFSNVVEELY